MAYIYIAHAPQDQAFVQKLSHDLGQANFDSWHLSNPDDEALMMEQLQKATHLLAVLSPAVELHEPFLGALEFARNRGLARLAIRIGVLGSLPPQLQGVLPLDFSDPEQYAEALETLLDDFRPTVTAQVPQLPADLLQALHSDNPERRQQAIEQLRSYRNTDDLKGLALEELRGLAFRERNSALKALIHTSIQLLEQDERPNEPEVYLPSKEELQQQAGDRALVSDSGPLVSTPSPAPTPRPKPKRYLWQARRWYPLLGGLAMIVALLLIGVTGQALAALPLLILGVVLPYFNVWIRKGGQFQWKMPGPVVGNGVLALLIGGGLALALLFLADLSASALVLSVLSGVAYAALVGWLSAMEV